ncbi:ABC transporter permease [Collinsella sp. AGMB00827]|uniref:ABC transporter permease n=1 Tax=Collinsella ureilytica TaxID=2869515 RepID=A0ABS7MLI9_9ACTN|nr:ABC transporter permease [Collinsella urealyticum]MBY4797931.1 ABC transporter permease [Collinsella urealyticum]
MTQASTSSGFSFSQFKTLLYVIHRGEDRSDALGMNSFDQGGSSSSVKKKFLSRIKIPHVALTILKALGLLGFAALMFFWGTNLEGTPIPLVFVLLAAMLAIMTLLTGIYGAINRLYFVRDLGYYLTLPVSAPSLMWAKLAQFLLITTAGDLLFLPIGFGALWASWAPWTSWVLFALGYIVSAITVNLVVLLICTPLMRFSRFARDRDRFSRFFGGFIMVAALSLGVSIQFLVQRSDAAAHLTELANGMLGRLNPAGIVLSILCPPVAVARQLFEGNPLDLLCAIGFMAAAVCLYAALLTAFASRWYMETVRTLQGAGGRKSHRKYEESTLLSVIASRPQLSSIISIDWKTLLRVPAFFSSFVLGTLLMPVYMVVVFGAVFFIRSMNDGMDLSALHEAIMSTTANLSFDDELVVIAAFCVLIFMLFMGFSAFASMFAVSRDGQDFFYFRSLPINWRKYLAAKLATALVLSSVVTICMIVIVLILVGFPPAIFAYLIAMAILSTVSVTTLSVSAGVFFPRLHWDNEGQLMRGGSAAIRTYTGSLLGAISVGIPALLLAWLLFWGSPLSVSTTLVAAFFAQLLMAAVSFAILFGPAAASLARREH